MSPADDTDGICARERGGNMQCTAQVPYRSHGAGGGEPRQGGAALDAVGADEQLRTLRGDGERAEAHHREGGDRKGCQRAAPQTEQRDRERAEAAHSAGLGASFTRTVSMRRKCP